MLEELKVKYWKSWKPNGMVWQCGNPGNSTRKKLVLPWGQERQREKLMKPRAGSQDFPVGAGTLERCSPCQGSCLRLEQGRCILTSPVLPPSDLLCFPLAYPGLMLEPGSLGNILIFTKRSFLWDRSSGERQCQSLGFSGNWLWDGDWHPRGFIRCALEVSSYGRKRTAGRVRWAVRQSLSEGLPWLRELFLLAWPFRVVQEGAGFPGKGCGIGQVLSSVWGRPCQLAPPAARGVIPSFPKANPGSLSQSPSLTAADVKAASAHCLVLKII